MIDGLLDQPSHQRERLASALESGMLSKPYSAAALLSVLGASAAADGILSGLLELDRMGVSGPSAGALIRSAGRAAARAPRLDLVWSGPEVPGLHARDTRRVFEELLGSPRRSVWASTYAFFDGPRAFEVLAGGMDSNPDVSVTLLLNIQRRRGETRAANHLVRDFPNKFWEKEWPGATRPRVFYDPRALAPDGPTGVLHAKAVVLDEEVAFVTSANLTEAALDRNIELGLLVRDHALAKSIVIHFRTLIEKGLLSPLPGD